MRTVNVQLYAVDVSELQLATVNEFYATVNEF